MSNKYILIDYENVQPKNLNMLAQDDCQVWIFVGANQAKINVDLVMAMQALGSNGVYIKISESGKNALDFHLAFYLGELASSNPKGTFYIISKDTGFDPLVAHLRSKKIKIQREKSLEDIAIMQASQALSEDEKITAIVKNLSGRGQSRPRKVKTLSNSINALFGKKLTEAVLSSLIKQLASQQYIEINNENITYKLTS